MIASRRTAAIFVIAAFGLCGPVLAQPSDPADPPERRGLVWRNRPTIQIGEHFRLDLRLKLQFDWRRFDPEIGEDTYDFRVKRGGVAGEIGNHIEFEIERDLHEDGRWRDVFVNWRTFREFEVMGGRFKVPFGREQLTGITDVDFVFRTLASTTIPPARDRGVMVHGRFFDRALTYQVGAFEGDGDNGRLQEPQFALDNPGELGPSYAARVTVAPLDRMRSDAAESLRVGVAYGWTDVPEGLNSLRGESVFGTTAFFEPVYVQGRRERRGAELSFTPGPIGVAAEWMEAREERLGQSLRGADLSDLIATGWYGSVTWLVTGEDKADFNGPRDPLFAGGAGAIEVGARYDVLEFRSANQAGTPSRQPRADVLRGNRDRVWTAGVNWFPNRWTRITANAIHETFDDDLRTPEPGTTEFWSGVLRLQIVF